MKHLLAITLTLSILNCYFIEEKEQSKLKMCIYRCDNKDIAAVTIRNGEECSTNVYVEFGKDITDEE